MSKLVLYLLEASAALAILYSLYLLLLSREISFNFNRFYLIGILILALLVPVMDFKFVPSIIAVAEHPVSEFNHYRKVCTEEMQTWKVMKPYSDPDDSSGTLVSSNTNHWNWKTTSLNLIILIYAIGVIVCITRTCWIILRLRKMICTNRLVRTEDMTVVCLSDPSTPFSFFRYVFVHDSLIGKPEFDQIISHERIHIQEKHSYDLIFVQLIAAFFWFNPIMWQLIKSLKTTHEYIADNKTIKKGCSIINYQTLLLSQLISNNSLGLVNNFNLSFIKKRIVMMQKSIKSEWTSNLKVGLTIASTILVAFLFSCSSKEQTRHSATVVSMRTSENFNELQVAQNNSAIEFIDANFPGSETSIGKTREKILAKIKKIKGDLIGLCGGFDEINNLVNPSEQKLVQDFFFRQNKADEVQDIINAITLKIKENGVHSSRIARDANEIERYRNDPHHNLKSFAEFNFKHVNLVEALNILTVYETLVLQAESHYLNQILKQKVQDVL